jgi:hypothetical protein
MAPDGVIRDFTEMNEYVLDGDSLTWDQKISQFCVTCNLIYKDDTVEGKKELPP